MKKFVVSLCAFLFGAVCLTCFGGTVEVGAPAKVKVVHPRIVQRTVVPPNCECEAAVAVGVPCGCGKIVQPRIVQRMVVPATCCECESTVCTDPARLAKVKTAHPRIVQRGCVAPTCGECGTAIDVSYPGSAHVKVVYPRVVQRGCVVPVPACE